MKAQLQPWQLLFLILAGGVNRRQQHEIEFLLTETRVLKETPGKKRVLLNDDQRRRSAKGKALGRELLSQPATIVTPETILRRHRESAACSLSWNGSGGGCATNPDESWMCQAARNPSDAEVGFLRGKKCMGVGCDRKLSEAFRAILERAGVEAGRLPPSTPNQPTEDDCEAPDGWR